MPAIIWNVEPGARRVESTLAGVGTRVSTYHVQVKADGTTEFANAPTPDGN